MLGCWVTMLQCCTESLSWLLDTRPGPSHTNLSNVPPLCTSTAGPHSSSALYQPHWLLAVYVCSSLPKHISIIPTQTPGGSRSIEWVGDTWRSQCLSVLVLGLEEEEDPGPCLRPPRRLQSPASPHRHPSPTQGCQDTLTLSHA